MELAMVLSSFLMLSFSLSTFPAFEPQMIPIQALIRYLLLPSTVLFIASQLSKTDPDDVRAFEPSENQGAAPNTNELTKPRVLIVGAGIGGLMLAFLLKKGGVPFLVLERAHEVKPLGE